MPLLDQAHTNELRRELATHGLAIFRGIALPQRYFAVQGSAGADLLFKRLDDGTGCIALIQQDVRYLGRDQALAKAFASRPNNGWRPIAVFRPAEPEAVLSQADILLGLTGRAPQLPMPSQPREIVVDPGELEHHAGGQNPEKDDAARFGTDLVEEARQGRLTAALFRDKETEALIRILSKEGKTAACLVGEPGVGKTKVVENLAVWVAQNRVPPGLQGARILDVNLCLLAAGATYQNEFEGRMKKVLDLARRDSNVILFLDEVHTIRAPGSNASQMVKSDLGRGRIRCIGATTNAEFRLIDTDAALARRFQVVPVPELTRDQTVEILDDYRKNLLRHHGVEIPDELLATTVDLATRYVSNRYLPDKALDLLDEACACARLEATPRAGAMLFKVRKPALH
jgi:ATP-dependent Clp protease ATP-binding subunit ClpA